MTRMAFRTCPLCEATCGLQLEVQDGRVTRIRGDADDPFSKGFICPKGSTLGALHEDPDRLRRPLVRRDGAHVEVSWDKAFAEIEQRLTALVSEHGRDAVAVYIGNPNAHNFANTLAIRPLVKALGTKNVYSASTVDQMPKHVAIRPGTDAALLAGIAQVLFAEGLADPGRLAETVTGIDLVEVAVAGFTP